MFCGGRLKVRLSGMIYLEVGDSEWLAKRRVNFVGELREHSLSGNERIDFNIRK